MKRGYARSLRNRKRAYRDYGTCAITHAQKTSILIGESFSTSISPFQLERQFTLSQYPTNRRFFTWTTLWIRFVGFDDAHPRTNFIFLKGRVGSGTRADALSQIATKFRPAVYPQTCSHRADLSRVLSAADGRTFDDTSILPGYQRPRHHPFGRGNRLLHVKPVENLLAAKMREYLQSVISGESGCLNRASGNKYQRQKGIDATAARLLSPFLSTGRAPHFFAFGDQTCA